MTVQKTVNYCCEVGASDMIAQVDLIPVKFINNPA